MAWTCPTCFRKFRITNQPHSCMVRDAAHHFSNKKPEIRAVFDKITGLLAKLGPVQISYVQNAILISATSTFLAVKPKKDRVDIEFILNHEVTDFPVHKTVRVSRNKVAHFVTLGTPDDLDDLVCGWIDEAFRENGRKTEDGGWR